MRLRDCEGEKKMSIQGEKAQKECSSGHWLDWQGKGMPGILVNVGRRGTHSPLSRHVQRPGSDTAWGPKSSL